MTERPPIILIGAARSGTRFLRDILGAGPGTAMVPYDVNYIWRYGAEGLRHDALDAAALDDARARFIRKALASVARSRPGDRLIEKTVSNTLRVPFVNRVFPQAVFVHLIRDGRDVAESAMRQWRAPPDWRALRSKLRGLPLRNVGYVGWFAGNYARGLLRGRQGGGVWGPRFPGIDGLAATAGLAETCAVQWVASVEAATRDLAALPQTRVHTIRYEALVADDRALTALVAALDLAEPQTILARWQDRVRPDGPALWRDLPDPDRAVICARTAPLLTRLGYPRDD